MLRSVVHALFIQQVQALCHLGQSLVARQFGNKNY